MIKNLAILVTFNDNKTRNFGYDSFFFETEEMLLKDIANDFKEGLKNVLFTSFTILSDDGSIDSFAVDGTVKADKYGDIVQSHVDPIVS